MGYPIYLILNTFNYYISICQFIGLTGISNWIIWQNIQIISAYKY